MALISDFNMLSRQTWYRVVSAACVVSGIIFANAVFFRFIQDERACLVPVSWTSTLKSYSLLGLVGCPLGLSQISKSSALNMEVHFWCWTALLIALINVFTFATNAKLRLGSALVLVALVVAGLFGNLLLSKSYD